MPALLQTKARETGVSRQLPRRAVGRHVEIIRIVDDLTGRPGGAGWLQPVHTHRNSEVLAERKERHGIRSRSLAEESVVRVELDFAVSVVIDSIEHLLGQLDRRFARAGGAELHLLGEVLEGKRLGVAILEAWRDSQHAARKRQR